MSPQSILKAAFFMAFAGVLSACGSSTPTSQFIKKANVRVYTEGETRMGEITATINSGQTIIPATEFPIIDPRNRTETLGKVSLRNALGGGSTEIAINMDINKLIKAQGVTHPYLPNGSLIPIAGIDPSLLQTFDIGTTGSKVYTSLDTTTQTAMVGVAVAVKNFKIGVAANVFYPFNFVEQGISGLVGIFTGPQDLQSGIALFADASAFLGNMTSMKDGNSVEFIPQMPPQSEYEKIQKMLWNLHSGRTVLQVR